MSPGRCSTCNPSRFRPSDIGRLSAVPDDLTLIPNKHKRAVAGNLAPVFGNAHLALLAAISAHARTAKGFPDFADARE